MNWQSEVTAWIDTLTSESQGLNALSEQLSLPYYYSSKSARKLQKTIEILKTGLFNLIDKSKSLLKHHSNPEDKLNKLRSEYNKALKSLSRLSELMNTPNPAYPQVTTVNTTRNRSLLRKDSKNSVRIRNKSDPPVKKVRFEETHRFTDIKLAIKNIQIEIKAHVHDEYEAVINGLEQENQMIRQKIIQAHEESRENYKFVEDLLQRIEQIGKRDNQIYGNSRSSVKSRVLLKSPSMSSEVSSLLKEYY